MKTFKKFDLVLRKWPELHRKVRGAYFRFFNFDQLLLRDHPDFTSIFLNRFGPHERIPKGSIVIDCQSWQGPSLNRGIGRYGLELTQSLIESNPTRNFVLLFNRWNRFENISKFLDKLQVRKNVFFYVSDTKKKQAVPLSEASKLIRDDLAKLNPSSILFLSVFENPYQVLPIRLDDKILHVAILYDLIPLIFPNWFLTNDNYKNEYERNIARLLKMDCLLSISHFSARSALELLDYGGALKIIGGSGFTLGPKSSGVALKQRRGIVCVASNSPHKNVERLIQAYALLQHKIRAEHHLIVTGIKGATELNRLRAIASEVGCEVKFFESMTDEDLYNLYCESRLAVIPSLVEGLGMPVLEAWNSGCVAIGSMESSMSEIIDATKSLFNPYSVMSIKKTLHRYLNSDSEWKREQARIIKRRDTFSWHNSARLTFKVLTTQHHTSKES